MTTRRTTPLTLTGRSPRRRRIVESVLMVVGFVVLLDALFGERSLVETIGTDQQHRAAKAALAKMREKNTWLREQIRLITSEDPATIEDLARDQGMIKRGEKVFIIRDVKPADE